MAGGSTPLHPAEAYVLGCGFVLHDAAMGLAAHREDFANVLGEDAWKDLVSVVFVDHMDRWPTDADLEDLPPDVLSACRSEAIRRTHADHAATLVDQPWPTSAKNEPFLVRFTKPVPVIRLERPR